MTHPDPLSDTLAETALALRDAHRPAPQPLPRRGLVLASLVAVMLVAGGAAPARADWIEAAADVMRACLETLHPAQALTCRMPLDQVGPGSCV